MKPFFCIRTERGNAFVDLALIIPILLMFIGGIFEVSRIYYIQNSLENGVKEAGRIGSQIKENFGNTTVTKSNIESLIKNNVRLPGVIAGADQFTIRLLDSAGNEVAGSNISLDWQNNPSAASYLEVQIKYPGLDPTVSSPIPAVFNPGNFFSGRTTLMSKSLFKIEGRYKG